MNTRPRRKIRGNKERARQCAISYVLHYNGRWSIPSSYVDKKRKWG